MSTKILEKPAYGFGYNAHTGEYGDLTSQGVIDPTKVVRNALQGAASIAGLLITTEAMVAEPLTRAHAGRHGRHGLLITRLKAQSGKVFAKYSDGPSLMMRSPQ